MRKEFWCRKGGSCHASKTIINKKKQTDHFLKKNPCKFAIAFALSCLSCQSKVFFSKTSTSRCLDQKRPDLASNIKKAVPGMAVMPTTKQQQSKEK